MKPRPIREPQKPAPPFPDFEPSTYGERIADVYDVHVQHVLSGNVDTAVDFLAALAGKRRALELGIGTGRIAIPLAARGVAVSGIDASPAMVEKMRAKPGGENIPVAIDDFAGVPVKGQFGLIYVVFNTFFALLTQDDQVRCFTRVAKRLRPDGAFVLRAFVPDLSRFDRGQRVSAVHVATDQVLLDVSTHDIANQTVRGQHVEISQSGVHLYPLALRYAYPSELDMMARIAGMRLRERWGGWNREPFTASSGTHISVYELAATGS